MINRTVSLICGSVLVVALTGSAGSFQKNKAANLTIDGYLYDVNGKPLVAAKVMVMRQGRTHTATTDKTGYYKIKTQPGKSYDVLYSHGNVGVSVVGDLVGDKSQQISKVLYRPNQLKTAQSVYESVVAYEKLIIMDLSGKGANKAIREALTMPGTSDVLSGFHKQALDLRVPKPVSQILISKTKDVMEVYKTHYPHK